MKFLFLVILHSQPSSGMHNAPIVQKVVQSPEYAALILWNQNQTLTYPAPGSNEAHLYQIDLVTQKIKEIPIPSIEFKTNGKQRVISAGICHE